MKIRFFRSPAELRRWFAKHHATSQELWVGFYKKGSGRPSITWPESVDEALCFGWIDGIRKSIDDLSYTIRFTPRRRGSVWSTINVRRAQALTKRRRMRAAGRKAFEERREDKSGLYSYENRPDKLEEPYASMFRRNPAAWDFFQAQPPWYRRTATWWIVSAKKDETRLKRLQTLIEYSARGRTIPPLTRTKTSS